MDTVQMFVLFMQVCLPSESSCLHLNPDILFSSEELCEEHYGNVVKSLIEGELRDRHGQFFVLYTCKDAALYSFGKGI